MTLRINPCWLRVARVRMHQVGSDQRPIEIIKSCGSHSGTQRISRVSGGSADFRGRRSETPSNQPRLSGKRCPWTASDGWLSTTPRARPIVIFGSPGNAPPTSRRRRGRLRPGASGRVVRPPTPAAGKPARFPRSPVPSSGLQARDAASAGEKSATAALKCVRVDPFERPRPSKLPSEPRNRRLDQAPRKLGRGPVFALGEFRRHRQVGLGVRSKSRCIFWNAFDVPTPRTNPAAAAVRRVRKRL